MKILIGIKKGLSNFNRDTRRSVDRSSSRVVNSWKNLINRYQGPINSCALNAGSSTPRSVSR